MEVDMPTIKRHRMTAAALAAMMSMLVDGLASVNDLREATGLNKDVIRKYLEALHNAKVARIQRWGADDRGRHIIPEWGMGAYEHATKPKPEAKTKIHARYDAKRRAPLARLARYLGETTTA
jgi:transcription initiation factor IIE alpha subunit